MDIAVGLVGPARAGKTVLARRLAERMSAPSMSFGDEVRRRAAAAGRGDDRLTLMEIGQQAVEGDLDAFCRDVLAQHRPERRTPLIIEGIRHTRVADLLRALLAPRRLVLVHLQIPPSEQQRRLREDGLDEPALQAVQSDPTEAEVDQALFGHADFVLDATLDRDVLAKQVQTWLEELAEPAARPPASSLDDQQQAEILNAMNTEFRLPVLAEASESLGLPPEHLLAFRDANRLLVLEHGRALLVPGFQLRPSREALANVIERLATKLDQWEIAAWFVAANSWLDDRRPVDVDADKLESAVAAELDEHYA